MFLLSYNSNCKTLLSLPLLFMFFCICITRNLQVMRQMYVCRPYRFSAQTETWKKKRTQGQEDGVDSITQTQAQPSFLSTVSGGWLSYKSSPSQRGTKHRNATASTSGHRRVLNKLITRFRFKCYSEKDVWNMTKLISETWTLSFGSCRAFDFIVSSCFICKHLEAWPIICKEHFDKSIWLKADDSNNIYN